MAQDEAKSSFLTTLPGILTSFAALVTAAGGIILGLYQYGVLGSGQNHAGNASPDVTSQPVKQETTAQQSKSSEVLSSSHPEDSANVRITKTDGTLTTIIADQSFYFCNGDGAIDLESGQSIKFDKITTIDVLSVDLDSEKTKLRIVLTDGKNIEGTANCGDWGPKGRSEMGDVDIPLHQVKRVAFPR
jgi:hypothetical protein